ATPSACSAGQVSSAVVFTSQDFGNRAGVDRGNLITVQVVDPNPLVANSPLSVTTIGNSITVTRATDASGVPVTTAGDVVAAVNADPSASALVTAQTYRGDVGSGTVATTGSPVHLSDFLFAPTSGQFE